MNSVITASDSPCAASHTGLDGVTSHWKSTHGGRVSEDRRTKATVRLLCFHHGQDVAYSSEGRVGCSLQLRAQRDG